MKVFLVWELRGDGDRFCGVFQDHTAAAQYVDNELNDAHRVGIPLQRRDFELIEEEVRV